MNAKGFTLLELLVVMGIVTILTTIGTLSFNKWTAKTKVESQVRTMFADLNEARSNAFYQKGTRSVVISSAQYKVYASSDVSVDPIQTTVLKYPVTTNPTALRIDFDQYGTCTFNSDSSTGDAEVCVQNSSSGAIFSCIVANKTRIQMGSLTSGTGCNFANITPQ